MRSLSLKRELVQELSTDELTAVVGGGETLYSCYAVISCDVLNTCFIRDTVLCVVN
jgi:bacteriocin-like protein